MSDPEWGAAPQDTSTHDVLGAETDRDAARTANSPVQRMADAIGTTEGAPGDLTDLGDAELLSLAKRHGFEGVENMSRAELIAELRTL